MGHKTPKRPQDLSLRARPPEGVRNSWGDPASFSERQQHARLKRAFVFSFLRTFSPPRALTLCREIQRARQNFVTPVTPSGC